MPTAYLGQSRLAWVFGLMLCCYFLKIYNHLKSKGLNFYFARGPTNYLLLFPLIVQLRQPIATDSDEIQKI